MKFNYESLTEEVQYLHDWWKENKNILKGLDNSFSEAYKIKYIDLLFEIYSSIVEFSGYYLDKVNINDKKYMKSFMNHFGSFVVAYARLVQFCEFADVELPDDIVDNFSDWVNKRIDLTEYLARIDK